MVWAGGKKKNAVWEGPPAGHSRGTATVPKLFRLQALELNLDDETRLLSSDHGVIPLSTAVYTSQVPDLATGRSDQRELKLSHTLARLCRTGITHE